MKRLAISLGTLGRFVVAAGRSRCARPVWLRNDETGTLKSL
jgi:hypothetical protein